MFSFQNSFFQTFLYGIFIISLCSRGFFELFIGKNLAYLIQLSIVSSSLVFLALLSKASLKKKDSARIIILLLFLIIMLLSALMSCVKGISEFITYLTVNLYIMFIVIFSMMLSNSKIVRYRPFPMLLLFGIILILTASAQQLGLLILPGDTQIFGLIRPSSITGSYLHYPIVISLFAFLLLQKYVLSNSKIYLYIGISCALAPFIAFSRSGMIIILAAMMNIVLYYYKNIFSIIIRIVFPLILFFGILFAIIVYYEFDLLGYISTRLFTATSLKAEGNEERLAAWNLGVEMWSKTNLLIGEYTGLVTNATRNFEMGDSFVVESGALQQLVNFGILGLFLFYAMMFSMYSMISRQHYLLRSVYLAGLFQTLFFQSIEVIPFITLLLMIPSLSSTLEYDNLLNSEIVV